MVFLIGHETKKQHLRHTSLELTFPEKNGIDFMLASVIYVDLQNLVVFPSHQHVEKPALCKVYSGETQSFLVNNFNHWSSQITMKFPEDVEKIKGVFRVANPPLGAGVELVTLGYFHPCCFQIWVYPFETLQCWSWWPGAFFGSLMEFKKCRVASKNGSRNMFLPGKDQFSLTSRSVNKSFGPKKYEQKGCIFNCDRTWSYNSQLVAFFSGIN